MAEGRLKHFGWGREGEGLSAQEERALLDRYRGLFGVDRFDERMPPALSDIVLRPPRIAPPPALAAHCSERTVRAARAHLRQVLSRYARGLPGFTPTRRTWSPFRATKPMSPRSSTGRAARRPR